MYAYEGYGLIVPLADFDERAFLDAMEDLRGDRFENLDDFANNEPIGTYESVDNVDYAKVNGNDIDASGGILIINCDEGFDPVVGICMELLGYPADWKGDPSLVGNYVVECLQ